MLRFFSFLILLSGSGLAQSRPAVPPCDCPQAFDFVVSTVKDNYSGWADKVTPANRAEMDRFTQQLRAKAPGATASQCYALLAQWTRRLRDRHTGIYAPDPATPPFTEKDPAKIRAYFAGWERIAMDEAAVKRYLDQNRSTLNPIEGIWRTADNGYTIAVVANLTPDRQFAGFVLKADGIYWQPGQVKMDFKSIDATTYGGTYFMRDHSPRVQFTERRGDTLRIARQGDWYRVYPAPAKAAPAPPANWRKDYADKFEMRAVDDSTMLLTLPNFDIVNKKIIDSLLATHRARLLKTPYFIIDVRANGGGWDSAYERIIDYVYTDTIISKSSKLLVTKENLNKWTGHYNDPNIPVDEKSYIGKMLEQMKKIPVGTYLDRPDDMTLRSEVYPLPRRVAVLMGRDCGSSGEEFVLTARQSKKVVLMGENTAGVIDYANVHDLPVPVSPFRLYYATSRTKRTELYDNVGIAPDVRIPAMETNWIDYARQYLRTR